MGSLDRRLDAATLDYVDDENVNGAFEECDVLENQIAISFAFAFKSWEGDPLLGHHMDDRVTDTTENRQRARDLARQSLLWLVEDGSLASVDAFIETFSAGRIAFKVEAIRPGELDPLQLPTFLVSVGGTP